MIKKKIFRWDTPRTPTYEGYALEDVVAELNKHGAYLVQVNCDYACIFCEGKIYGPDNWDELKRLVDLLELCAYRAPLKTVMGRLLYQVIWRQPVGLKRVFVYPPNEDKYSKNGIASLIALKKWAQDELNGLHIIQVTENETKEGNENAN